MIVVALVAAAGWAASVAMLAGLLRSQQRAHARREDLLINQLLHAVDKTWQEPPSAQTFTDLLEEELVLVDPDQQEWTV